MPPCLAGDVTAPRLRWSFGLRTMFVLVAVAAIPLCWFAASLNWIIARNDFKRTRATEFAVPAVPGHPPVDDGYTVAPGFLWLLGERGLKRLAVENPADLETARRLFPETEIVSLGPVRPTK